MYIPFRQGIMHKFLLFLIEIRFDSTANPFGLVSSTIPKFVRKAIT